MAAGRATPAAAPSARFTLEASTGLSVLVPSEATLDCNDGARADGLPGPRRQAGVCARATRRPHRRRQGAPVARVCTEVYGGPQRRHHRHGRAPTHRGLDQPQRRLRHRRLGPLRRCSAIPSEVVRCRGRAHRSTTTTVPPPATYHVAARRHADRDREAVQDLGRRHRGRQPTGRPRRSRRGQALVMPPPSAVRIDVALVNDTAGEALGLKLVGAQPSELVTFVITLPDGNTYTGSPHAVGLRRRRHDDLHGRASHRYLPGDRLGHRGHERGDHIPRRHPPAPDVPTSRRLACRDRERRGGRRHRPSGTARRRHRARAGRHRTAPLLAMLFADMGARIVRVDPAGRTYGTDRRRTSGSTAATSR